MYNVFLSSTGKDLAEYRKGAIEVCNRLGLVPIGMEFFEAMGKGASEGSKRKLDGADVYVGIFAHRYGYTEQGYDKSVTEIEFDYAGDDLKLDRLCFVIDPDYQWLPSRIDFANYDKLTTFKTKINSLIRDQFTTVEDLKLKLFQALVAWRQEREHAPAAESLANQSPADRASTPRMDRMMFGLPAAQFDEEALIKLGAAMTAEFEDPIPEDRPDPEENPGISAGYTYLGQFIYNDLTNQRGVPRFDLSCVYGLGPRAQPFLYAEDARHIVLGEALTGAPLDRNARAVLRNQLQGASSRALISDARNDENVILSQMHAAFLRFHNRIVDLGFDFESARQLACFHYQWVVLYDFLPRVIGLDALQSILPHLRKGTDVVCEPPQLRFYNANEVYLPLEFSVAAYRFGHSMIRPVYRLNGSVERLPLLPMHPDFPESLIGFRNFPANWAIDWGLFFEMTARPPKLGPRRIQCSYKVDTSIVNPLGNLPASVSSRSSHLATRNLMRGVQKKLPSGQAVARAMASPPFKDDELFVGKATEADKPSHIPLVRISPTFANNAPLWYYILAEAQQTFVNDDTPIRLGRVGGRIIGEVFVGVMLADNSSFLRQDPSFRPMWGSGGSTFTMADLLRQSMQA